MKKREAQSWLAYAKENLGASEVILNAGYLNPSLQQAQQAVEKSMKALVLESGLPLKKTHSIRELKALLMNNGTDVCITVEDCHLLDSIYIPSKYPLGGCLPDSEPDDGLCRHCLQVAKDVVKFAANCENG